MKATPNNSEPDYQETNDASPGSFSLRAARRTRASFGMVAVVVLSAVGSCAFKFAAERNPLAFQGIFLMAFLGVALLMIRPLDRVQLANELRILAFYKSPRFYGTVVSISAGLMLIFAFATTPALQVKVRARLPSAGPAPAPLPEVPPVPAPPKPLAFPVLELTGVSLSGSRSAALINGRTLFIGEYISAVKLVEVREDEVVVELQGFQKTIPRNSHRAASGASPSPK